MAGVPVSRSSQTRAAISAMIPDRRALPGIVLCLAVAAAGSGLSGLLSGLSPLIIAIILGILATNLIALPTSLAPGIEFSAKKLLRAGIILLGLKLVIADILGLGAPMLLVVVAIVSGGLLGTVLLGRLLGVRPGLALLIGCGFSICGAAAVAAAAGVTDPDDKAEADTVTAVALVVIFGTAMIPLLPLAAGLLKLPTELAGLWAGGAIHEIAQVVAAGTILGATALSNAVVVKLARVLLLAPVIAVLSIRQRRLSDTSTDQPHGRTNRPPIVPGFIIGFLVMVLVRSFAGLPSVVLDIGSWLQTLLLAAAMFGLGTGVKIRNLLQLGARPFALAGSATVLVAGIAYLGVNLAG